MIRTFVALCLLTAPFVSSGAAFAAPVVTATSADPLVEIAWSDPAPDRARVALALPPDHACSSIDIEHDRRVLQVSVCRNGGDADAPNLELQIERVDHGTPQVTRMKLQANVRLRRGSSMPIGRFERADHPSEVLVSLR